ncbi:PIG-L family deacetylase [Phycisphaera mikurensis]|uniref:PIG-L family deacetylase n=1 Tax=Phycisphaera mikurensis TaxID=547188 RepID=UPI0014615A81|nr:PIG-L family deacetylase [Phycisphaera mikurensis]MBB6440589.1 LmbE family N-acetylglucosaminyl deacetylase [Phycisphaera mikurensis]
MPDRPEGVVLDRAADAPWVGLDELCPTPGLVVLVPHPDDESLGCGLALAAAAAAGRRITLVLLTDGEGSHPGSATHPPEVLARLRRAELDEAIDALCPDEAPRVVRLGLPDGRCTADDALAHLDAARALLDDAAPATVWTTWSGDPHCDHEAAAALAEALAADPAVAVWSYAVWGRFGPARASTPGLRRFACDEMRPRKRAAAGAHRSQLTPLIADAPDAFLMPEALTEHFLAAPELFLPGTGRPADRRATFDALHAGDADHWSVTTSGYERQKRAVTLAALPRPGYARALEAGCGIGVLTAELAPRCGELLALDVSPNAVERARVRLARHGHVRVGVAELPAGWPAGTFDLIVLSELLYFLSADEVADLSVRAAAALAPDGVCLLVNWTGPNDLPLDGDAAAGAFRDAAGTRWHVLRADRHEGFRLDLLRAATRGG